MLNDHVLKGSGLLPSWMTGKLSDFAGMVVAPVLLVALVGARSRRAKMVAMGVVAAAFSAINLSPAAANAAMELMQWVGVPWRIVVDPTDLMGLAALPVAFWLTTARAARREKPWAPYAKLAAGSLAAVSCVATSAVPADWSTTGYLVNNTQSELTVRIQLYEGQVECAALDADAARMLAKNAFGPALSFTLAAQTTLPLGYTDLHNAAGVDISADQPGLQDGCEVLLITADGMPDSIVWWQDGEVPHLSVPTDTFGIDEDDASLKRGRLDLDFDLNYRLRLRSPGDVHLDTLGPLAPSDCGELGQAFEWSEPASLSSGAELHAIDALPGGCFDLTFGVLQASGPNGEPELVSESHLNLCIPEEAQIFEVGDVLQRVWEMEPRLLRITADDGDELVVSSRLDPEFVGISVETSDEAPNADADADAAMACNGVITACGGFVRPVALTLANGKSVGPGESAELEPESGRTRRVFVGRSENVLAAPDSCDERRNQLGIETDLAITYKMQETR